MATTVTLTCDLSPAETITGTLSDAGGAIQADTSIPTVVSPPFYDGEYVVTPGPEAVTLETSVRVMRHNITINPVPSNYGLITWDGSTLTVS